VKRLNKISVLLALLLIGCSNNIQNESTGKDFLPENVSLNELSKYSVIYPLEIDFWSGLGPSINASLTKVIEDFGDLYPNIKVNLESRAGQIEESVLLSIPSDTYPNLVTVFPEHLTSFMKSDIVYALDPYLENEIYGFDLTTFDSELLAVNQRFYNNSLGNPYTFGLPFLARSQVMYANDDFLKFAQSLDDKLVVPKTWNGLEE
jgi:ABC-type glycerol-3-phosphate transport system substrate-binding protein